MKYSIIQLSHFIIPVICILSSVFSPAECQHLGDFTGKIIDAQTSHGIAGAWIKIEELDSTVKGDEAGNFILHGIPEGNYTLTLQAPGYGRTVILGVPIIRDQIVYQEYFFTKR